MLRTLAPRLKEGDGGLPFHTQLEDVFFFGQNSEFRVKSCWNWLNPSKAWLQNRLVAQVLTSLEFFVTVKVDVSSVSKSCVQ